MNYISEHMAFKVAVKNRILRSPSNLIIKNENSQYLNYSNLAFEVKGSNIYWVGGCCSILASDATVFIDAQFYKGKVYVECANGDEIELIRKNFK